MDIGGFLYPDRLGMFPTDAGTVQTCVSNSSSARALALAAMFGRLFNGDMALSSADNARGGDSRDQVRLALAFAPGTFCLQIFFC